MRNISKTGLASACLLFCGLTSFGQTTTATITGTVTDPSGAVVPSAKVLVTSEAEGSVRDMLTGPTGVFTAPNLTVGRYRLQVTAAGFASYELTGVTLSANQI